MADMRRIAVVGGALSLFPLGLPVVQGLEEAHEARKQIAAVRSSSETDIQEALSRSPISVQPVRLDPQNSSVNNCSGVIVNGNIYTAKHCFYTNGGDGELEGKTFDIIAQDGSQLGTIDSADFNVDQSDFAVHRLTEDVCERKPVQGEKAWTVHWIGSEDKPFFADFTVGNANTSRPNLFEMDQFKPGSELYKGSSGAGIFATSDGCLIGVATAISATGPNLGGVQFGHINGHYFTAVPEEKGTRPE